MLSSLSRVAPARTFTRFWVSQRELLLMAKRRPISHPSRLTLVRITVMSSTTHLKPKRSVQTIPLAVVCQPGALRPLRGTQCIHLAGARARESPFSMLPLKEAVKIVLSEAQVTEVVTRTVRAHTSGLSFLLTVLGDRSTLLSLDQSWQRTSSHHTTSLRPRQLELTAMP